MEGFASWDELSKGSEEAWSAFYRAYAPLLKRILAWSRWSFSREEQEEMLQEVLISLLHAVKKYRGEAKLSTFAAQVARNNCVSAIRKKLTRKRGNAMATVSLDEIEEFQPSDETPVAENLVERDEKRRLESALEKLEPSCRELIRFRYFEDRTFQDLATAMGQPIGTLASRLKRCLFLLKTFLGEREQRAP